MIAQLGLPSAARLSVSESASPLPDMSGTIRGYFRPLVMVRVRKTVKDCRVSESQVEIRCAGMIQPFGSRDLRMKPEGQRSWKWVMLHCTPDVALENDEEFTIHGTRYRVMAQFPYQDYGYRQYELVQDYQ